MVHADSFTVASVSSNGTRRVTLTGDLDLASAPVLSDVLNRATPCFTRAVVLDLSAVTFIDCAGLRAVFAFSDRVRARGWRLRIVRPPSQIARIFTLFDSGDSSESVRGQHRSPQAAGALTGVE